MHSNDANLEIYIITIYSVSSAPCLDYAHVPFSTPHILISLDCCKCMEETPVILFNRYIQSMSTFQLKFQWPFIAISFA